MATGKRLYITPTKRICNANCKFCYMKDKIVNSNPEFININKLFDITKDLKYDEVEITGGGEPTLHPNILEIVNHYMNLGKKVKIYTNGFKLIDNLNVSELNISRIHWDEVKNNEIYLAPKINKLDDVISHYRKTCRVIRLQTILLKGYIDNEKKVLELINKYLDVDKFMFRTLFNNTDRLKELYIDFDITHEKAIKDTTLDNYTRNLYFINSACEIFEEFQYD